MRAAVLSEQPPRLECVELPTPEPGPGEVLLQVTGCGICGSDLHLANHLAAPGSVLGHEIAGTVAGSGPDVDAAMWRATSVAVRPFAGCGRCWHCRRGRADHCATFQLVGFERPGGFAEYVTVRADELFTLPAVINTDEQPLVEPLAVVRHAFRRAQLVSTDTVAVLGAGPIGLAAVAWAVAMGVSTVVVSEPSAPRRQLAARLGATSVLDPASDDVVAGVAEATDGGPSAVIECSGQPGLIEQGIEMAGVDGRIIVVGVCPQHDQLFPFWAMSKELDIRFSIYYGREDFTDTLDALVGRRLNALPMVTETVGLDELPERFARLVQDRDSGKVIVRP